MSKIFNTTLKTLPVVAQQILEYTRGYSVGLFDGEMGSGKTALIKALGRALGITDIISSPTFSIVHEYVTAKGYPVYHLDVYRLSGGHEARGLDLEIYFNSGHCLVEWPSKIHELWPERYFKVDIKVLGDIRQLDVALIPGNLS